MLVSVNKVQNEQLRIRLERASRRYEALYSQNKALPVLFLGSNQIKMLTGELDKSIFDDKEVIINRVLGMPVVQAAVSDCVAIGFGY